ncbi:azaleucine resistance protein AzlC [Streptomyces chartreusis NRRL 3882]|uniref:Azaleucine resistance protein AzlC n=1 Tax=Streptomyces chartreusis NRRL 3882 TaxID=1079985 RepID=A0A2N9BKY1_STRCX|nr:MULTISPECIES: AzlC family ABC transporter permease [Streptomyces]MYS94590.1 hypothetical protein [Streptomyces sp. SID5464]SOR84019.1 azaleucine resistance protein AzlC [Streptomyces chartreusis NRRL 3882]
MATAAAPLASIAVAAFLVRARHVFYALSFPLHRVRGRLARTYSTFALTDEAYALTSTERSRSWSSERILWLQFFMHLYWAGSATAGALLGSLVPDGVTGLDFALTALFVVLAVPQHPDARRRDGDPGRLLPARPPRHRFVRRGTADRPGRHGRPAPLAPHVALAGTVFAR